MNILEARRRTLGADVYKKTETGNPVSVRSLARMRPGLNVYGKSIQQTTTGAQLIPFELGTEIVSKSGLVRCIPKEDGFYMEVKYGVASASENDIYFVGNKDSNHEVGYREYGNLSAGDYRVAINSMDFRFYVVAWRNGSEIIFDSSNQSLNKGFTVQDGDKFRIFLRPVSSASKSGVVQAIISKQNTELMYEPYTGGKPSPSPDYSQEIHSAGDSGTINITLSDGESQSQMLPIQTPNGLPGIPVDSGGNYTDAEGQQWICDEIDFKRGKYVQRVAWVTFDGSDDELWIFDLGGPGPDNLFPRGRVLMYGMCSQKFRNRVLCNRKIYSPTVSYDTENTCFSSRSSIYIYDEKATTETDTEWRQELSEKPVTVLYELETPIETDLTEEQLQFYANLHTNRPTTVVTATDGAWMKLTYKTKKSLEVTD